MKNSIKLVVIVLISFSVVSFAQGVIVPNDQPNLPRGIPLPVVKSQSVNVSIKSGAAVTTVNQVFLNKWQRAVEGVYLFPVPKGATVSEFAMWIDGKRVKGELLSKEEASRIYHDIVRRMKDPALLELAEFNLFKASVFPIPANGEKQIELKYTEALPASSGLVKYAYPLKGRGKTYLEPIGTFSLAVSIESNIAITGIYSPTHKVDVTRKGETAATVGMEAGGFVPESDFQLYYSLSDKEFGLSFASYLEPGEELGYFMMLLAPRVGLERDRVAAKDVIFVLDTSGSMLDNDKIGQALSALTFGLKSLRSEDRFGLVTFSTEVRPFREQLIGASAENVAAAVAHLEKVSATGATNIYEALQASLRMFGDSTRPRYLVFLTDGLPTHIERDPAVIVKKAGEWAPEGVRVFTWGVGFDVDTFLLDSISKNHDGVSEYVKPQEEMELKLGQFFEKITYPILTDLELDVEGLKVTDIYPDKLPDLFKGSQLVIFGRYKGAERGKAVLSGNVGDKKLSFTYPIATDSNSGGDFIAHLWATRRVGNLLEGIRLHGENEELKNEVIHLAKKFGLVTPYTSYLVTEPGYDRARLTNRNQPTITGEAPIVNAEPARRSGTAKESVQIQVDPSTGEIIEKKVGEGAVQRSRDERKLKEEELADSSTAASVRRVAGKTFNLVEGKWIDSEYKKEMKFVKVILNSDEYFELIKKDTRMAQWLSLGEKVIVVFNGTAYEITPE